MGLGLHLAHYLPAQPQARHLPSLSILFNRNTGIITASLSGLIQNLWARAIESSQDVVGVQRMMVTVILLFAVLRKPPCI